MVRSLIRSIILSSRWLQIIMYFALVLVLVSIIYAIIRDSIELLINSGGVQGHYSEGLIISALTICELALLANLIVVVMVSGYQNFIDHIGSEKTNKGILWITGLDYTKVKAIILSSIVAISSVQLLKLFLDSQIQRIQIKWLQYMLYLQYIM